MCTSVNSVGDFCSIKRCHSRATCVAFSPPKPPRATETPTPALTQVVAASTLPSTRPPAGKQPRAAPNLSPAGGTTATAANAPPLSRKPAGKQPKKAPSASSPAAGTSASPPRSAAKKQRQSRDTDDEESDGDSTREEGSSSGGENKRVGQKRSGAFDDVKAPFKRLKKGDRLKQGYERIENIVDYTLDARGELDKVQVKWMKGQKKEWIPVSWVDDISVFEYDLETIDMWKESGTKTLAGFLRTGEGKARTKISHGADDDRMSCGYRAVGTALDILHLPNPVTDAVIREFRSAGALRRHTSPEEYEKRGVTWKALRAFIEKKVDSIDLAVVQKNLYHGDGIGVSGLAKLGLEDGVYLVGGISKEKIGHCFVAEVECNGEGVSIHDNNTLESVDWLHHWLHSISYVRRVVPRNVPKK
jgi:hypothetical protein